MKMIMKKAEYGLIMERNRRAMKLYKEGKTNNLCVCDMCEKERGEIANVKELKR